MSSVSSSSSNQIGNLLQQQQGYSQKNNVGLSDRNTVQERSAVINQARQTVVENHGFDARQATKEALTHNNKIINTPTSQRGGLVNILA